MAKVTDLRRLPNSRLLATAQVGWGPFKETVQYVTWGCDSWVCKDTGEYASRWVQQDLEIAYRKFHIEERLAEEAR